MEKTKNVLKYSVSYVLHAFGTVAVPQPMFQL